MNRKSKLGFIVGATTIVIALFFFKGTYNYLPIPTGKYSVGTVEYHLIDESRKEEHEDEGPNFRELMLHIWYPSESNKSKALYIKKNALETVKSDLSGACQICLDDLSFLDSFKSNSFENSPISKELPSYPVIIFIPGFGMPVNLYSSLHNELASQGYIVIAINFPYVTNPVVFPDGRVVKSIKSIDKDKEFNTWLQDIKFVLDKLENLNDKKNLFEGKLNLAKIGIYGHSFGGGIAIKIFDIDKRITAGINLDGKLREKQEDLDKPFIFINSKQSQEDLAPLRNLNQIMSAPGYFVAIENINHGAFTDIFLLIKNCKNIPELAPNEATKIIRAIVVDFFDKYLKDKDINVIKSIEKLQEKYPKLILEANEKTYK